MSLSARRKKLLVLTSATGAGHDTHAQATVEWCSKLYADAVTVRVEHILEDSHWFYRAGVSFYNRIQRNAPWFHHIYYHVVEFLDFLNFGSVSLGREYYISLLKDFRPDAILSVHDCLNRGYFEQARKVLGPDLRCATYCPEFSGGYGFSANWVNPRGDYFFARTEETIRFSSARHLPEAKAVVAGHWAPTAFYSKPMSRDEKSRYLTQELGLKEECFTLLLSTGGAGAQNHLEQLKALEPLAGNIQVIALCGRDEKARLALDEWAKKGGRVRIRALGFRTDMRMLLQVCSAVVARAGATTAGEALLCGCPVIFNAMGGMMPQEMPTWRYFKRHGVGSVGSSAEKIARIVETWVSEPETMLAIKAGVKGLRDATTPEAALRRLLEF